MATAKSNSGVLQNISIEDILSLCLREKLERLPKESIKDLTELFGILIKIDLDPCEAEEVLETITEILFPETMGKLCHGRMHISEEIPENLNRRMIHIGDKIRSIRREKNINQEQLGKLAGLPQSHISRIESGQHSPSHKTLEKISAALEVSIGELDPSYS